jgi:hypothetical protein
VAKRQHNEPPLRSDGIGSLPQPFRPVVLRSAAARHSRDDEGKSIEPA